MAMLELRGVRAGYGRLPVLFDLDLDVDAGEWIMVLGANGAGRSTLLKTIIGAVAVSAGDIFFQGERITHDAPHRRVAAGISISPEGRRILPSLSVKDNLVAAARGVGRRELAGQLASVYEVFPKLQERAEQRGGSLSGGEQQMLAVGRALMSRPRLLLIDELSLGLAPIIIESLYTALSGLRERGLAVLSADQVHIHTSLAGYEVKPLMLEKGRFVSNTAWDLGVGAMAGT